MEDIIADARALGKKIAANPLVAASTPTALHNVDQDGARHGVQHEPPGRRL